MEAHQPPDSPKPTPTPTELPGRASIRVSVGAGVGWFAGGLIGWLIDSAITSDPYAGIRFGSFLGGLLGGVIGIGTGWRGAVLVLCIVCCMTAGGFAAIALWNPDPNSFVMFIPAGIGVIVGAIVGLGLTAVLLRVLFRPRPPEQRQAEPLYGLKVNSPHHGRGRIPPPEK